MNGREAGMLLLLGAIWGGSFYFMRLSGPEMGAVVLMGLRVALAALALLGLLAWRGSVGALRRHARPLAVLGLINSALPFCMLTFTTMHTSAGFGGILNATAALWAAVLANLWLGEPLQPARKAGLLIGFAGVLLVVWDRLGFKSSGAMAGLAVLAGLGAGLLYGLAANYARRHLQGVPALVSATGSQVAASLLLLPLLPWLWPARPPSATAWFSVLALGLVCTALAYLLYFGLIRRVGPSRASTVTLLVPVFALAWGVALLGEELTPRLLAGAAVVLLGTALSTGLLRWPLRTVAAAGAHQIEP